jgi:hypothetical protein
MRWRKGGLRESGGVCAVEMPNSENDWLFIVGERLGRFRTIKPGVCTLVFF